jgi:hypothetical protein
MASLKKAIQAKCYDCTGQYVDGRVDCGCPNCPLYQWMPYRRGRQPDEGWLMWPALIIRSGNQHNNDR